MANMMESQQRTAEAEITKTNKPTNPLVEQLQRQVANGFVLYMNYKHYHWQTHGPLFRDLHKLFDRLSREVLETIDPLAERIRMIGQDPVAAPVDVVRAANVKVADRTGSMRDMVTEADANLMVIIRDMRAGARIADENNDPGSVDLFSRIVQVHERHEWFLRELLRHGDGLVT
jgi:starvation-inducible DNA-binding protein